MRTAMLTVLFLFTLAALCAADWTPPDKSARGVRRSKDKGETFTRVDGGKICAQEENFDFTCHSLQNSGEGGKTYAE
jgi:hypothetical protein